MTFTFNTGRLYTAQGQIIEATVVSIVASPKHEGFADVTIRFNDTSRMIKGEFTVLEFDDYTPTARDVERSVMGAYDSGKYTNI